MKKEHLEEESESPKKDKIEKLKDTFQSDQEFWTEKVEEHAKCFAFISKMPNLQVVIYTDRQILVESKSKLLMSRIKINKSIRDNKKKAFTKAKTNSDILLKTYSDINIYIESELKDDLEKIELLDMQIDFLVETIKTIDNMIYGIRSRIELDNITS